MNKQAQKRAATRAAILNAARASFMAEGYDQVGVREIAARAGIDPALIIRYFGSKEGLFAEAVGAKFDLSALIAGDLDTLGERLAAYILGKKTADEPYDPLPALLRSASSEVAGPMLRDALRNGFTRPLSARLEGPDAEARAELTGSILLGLLVHGTVVGPGCGASNERMLTLAAPVLQAVIDRSISREQGGDEA